MNERLRCENSNEATSSFPILLFITSVVQSVILILLICGLNDYFLSCCLFLNGTLRKVKGFPVSKQSGARNLRAEPKIKKPFHFSISRKWDYFSILSYSEDLTFHWPKFNVTSSPIRTNGAQCFTALNFSDSRILFMA